MSRGKPEVEVPVEEEVVDAPEVETAPVPVEEEEVEITGDSVTVKWPGGSRVYSKAVHGKDFKALAKEFAGKAEDRVIG